MLNSLPVCSWLENVDLNRLTNEQLVAFVRVPVGREREILEAGWLNLADVDVVGVEVRRRCLSVLGLEGSGGVRQHLEALLGAEEAGLGGDCVAAAAYSLGLCGLSKEALGGRAFVVGRRLWRRLQRLERRQQEAKEQLVNRNSRLVAKIAGLLLRKYPVDKEDLFAVGRNKLLECINAYDYRRGTKFVTLAYQAVWRACQGYALRECLQVHVPNNKQTSLLRAMRAWQRGDLDLDSLSWQARRELLLFWSQLSSLEAASAGVLCGDEDAGENLWRDSSDTDYEQEQLLANNILELAVSKDKESNIDQFLADVAGKQLQEELLRRLPPLERRVCELRLQGGCRLQDIVLRLQAENLTPRPLSKERVRQIYISGLAKLQAATRQYFNGQI